MEALISVIIPVYNVEEYLHKCIKSVVEQTYSNLEIILVDDGSSDKCPIICDEWEKKDNRIKVIHKQNGGLSDARNAGLNVATGDYISFIDSDDWINHNMYKIMLMKLEQEKADICACGISVRCEQKDENRNIPSFVGNSENALDLLYDNTLYPVNTWNKLYKRQCWENLRFPVGKICEDAFTTYLLVDQAEKIVQISEPLYYYRIRENSIMTSSFSRKRMDEEEAWRCNYEFMEKKYPQLKKKAFDFYLMKVNILIHEIKEEQKREFTKEYEFLYDILKSNVAYILFFSNLPLKYRVKFLLDFRRL